MAPVSAGWERNMRMPSSVASSNALCPLRCLSSRIATSSPRASTMVAAASWNRPDSSRCFSASFDRRDLSSSSARESASLASSRQVSSATPMPRGRSFGKFMGRRERFCRWRCGVTPNSESTFEISAYS